MKVHKVHIVKSTPIIFILSIFLILSLSGCGKGFYLPESDVSAYKANLATEQGANNLLGYLQDKDIYITFDYNNGAQTIRSSNILATLRDIPNLFGLDQVSKQIELERLSTQLEYHLGEWIDNKLSSLDDSEGYFSGLKPVRYVEIHFDSAPNVTYNAEDDLISYDMTVQMHISGTLKVRDSGNILEDIIEGATGITIIPDGEYNITVHAENYRIRGNIHLNGSRARLSLYPSPGRVNISGVPDRRFRESMEVIVKRMLSTPLAENGSLIFDDFGLYRVNISENGILEADYIKRRHDERAGIDIVARSEAGRLYHLRQRSGKWMEVTEIRTNNLVRSDPTMVSSGPDTLELVAVTDDGSLLYTGYRNGEWGQRFVAVPETEYDVFSYTKPALISTAPGQLEVIALRGYDGELSHFRRVDGRWSGPLSVPDMERSRLPMRDPVVVRSGNKMVLLYVDRNDRLYASAFDIETGIWGQATHISTSGWVHGSPAAASCGDGRIDVVYKGRNDVPYHRVLDIQAGNFSPEVGTTGISLSPEASVGGEISGTPVLSCSGYKRLELIARGNNNRILHNHYVGPKDPTSFSGLEVSEGWQGWEPASKAFFGTPALFSVPVEDGISVDSTNSGIVHVVARRRGSGSTGIYYNRFESSRYGKRPWKTVHWRGLDRIKRESFTGSPAIAVSGQRIEITSVGNDGNIHLAELTKNSIAEFSKIPASPVLLPRDHVFLSTGPGMLDIIFPTPAEGLKHIRRYNDTSSMHITVPAAPSGNVSSPLSAVSYGNGQIELVGFTEDWRIYHWRYINGRWDTPSEVMSVGDNLNIISYPVLVGMGSGRLMLLAVKSDRGLYRWDFVSGSWESPEKISGSIAVSAVTFNPLNVSSYGDGTLDIVVIEDGTNKLYHTRILPEGLPQEGTITVSGQHFSEVGGEATEAVLTSFDPYKMNLLVTRPDRWVESIWSYKHESFNIPIMDSDAARRAVERMGEIENRLTTGSMSGSESKTKTPGIVPLMAEGTDRMVTAGERTKKSPLNKTLRRADEARAGTSDPMMALVRPIETLAWGNPSPICRCYNSTLAGGVARLGNDDMYTVVLRGDGNLVTSRFNGVKWSPFMRIPGQKSGDWHTPYFRPDITSR